MQEFIIKYWVLFILTTITGYFTRKFIKLNKQFEKIKLNYTAVENGMVALLRVEIINIYNQYCDEKCMPIYAKETFYGLYETYTALGGNGTIKSIHNQVNSWPSKE